MSTSCQIKKNKTNHVLNIFKYILMIHEGDENV
jgi:hypothetical protein